MIWELTITPRKTSSGYYNLIEFITEGDANITITAILRCYDENGTRKFEPNDIVFDVNWGDPINFLRIPLDKIPSSLSQTGDIVWENVYVEVFVAWAKWMRVFNGKKFTKLIATNPYDFQDR